MTLIQSSHTPNHTPYLKFSPACPVSAKINGIFQTETPSQKGPFGGVLFLDFFHEFLFVGHENFLGASVGHFWQFEKVLGEVDNFWSFQEGLKKILGKKRQKWPKKHEVLNFKTRFLIQFLLHYPPKIFSRGNIAKECPPKIFLNLDNFWQKFSNEQIFRLFLLGRGMI